MPFIGTPASISASIPPHTLAMEVEPLDSMISLEHAYFAGDRAQIAVTATVHAFLFFQNTGAKRLLFDEIECLGDRKRIGLGEFFENRRLYLRSQSIDRFSARTFTFGAQRLFESIVGNLTGDIHHL